tara:strand:+ start:646 stop:762 length:117 start_codon:yes stop_codon:yes gene_type:complete
MKRIDKIKKYLINLTIFILEKIYNTVTDKNAKVKVNIL